MVPLLATGRSCLFEVSWCLHNGQLAPAAAPDGRSRCGRSARPIARGDADRRLFFGCDASQFAAAAYPCGNRKAA